MIWWGENNDGFFLEHLLGRKQLKTAMNSRCTSLYLLGSTAITVHSTAIPTSEQIYDSKKLQKSRKSSSQWALFLFLLLKITFRIKQFIITTTVGRTEKYQSCWWWHRLGSTVIWAILWFFAFKFGWLDCPEIIIHCNQKARLSMFVGTNA